LTGTDAGRESRVFTVEEADALVPELRARLGRIRGARSVLIGAAEKIAEGSESNGGGEDGPAYFEANETLRTEVEAIVAQGIILRDAESGLVDFPSEREGREVFLCWRPQEETVSYWHEVDSGFSSRKPL
jgi:hypothetical protein